MTPEIQYTVQGLVTHHFSDIDITGWEEHALIDDEEEPPQSAAEAFELMRRLGDAGGYYERVRVVRITQLVEELTFDEAKA